VRVAVVGHVEWIDFLAVEGVPRAGEIVTAREHWGEPGGGGGVAAARLAQLAGECTLFTALGSDAWGRACVDRLETLGVRCAVAWRETEQRRGFCYLDDDGERTITLLSEKLRPRHEESLPWDELAEFDAVYFTGGDVGALAAARAAGVLVATSRELDTLREAGVEVDALVGSARDPDERYEPGDLEPAPRHVFTTEGGDGGRIEPGARRWQAAELPGPRADSYGAGDTFAAHVTYALGEGRSAEAAAAFAAGGSAEQLTRRGAHGSR
jgi:ribokinase